MPTPRELIEEGIRYEAGGMLDRALTSYRDAAVQAQRPRDRAEALRRSADVYRTRCDWDAAVASARESADLARANRLDDLLAEAMNAEAAVDQSRGGFQRARELYEQMLTVTTNPRIRGIALQNLGSIAAMEGDFHTADARFVDSLECFQRCGYTRGIVFTLNNRGRIALDRGAYSSARAVLQEAELVARRLMDLDLLALVRLNLAESLLHDGDCELAQDLASAALGHYGSTQNHWRRIECLRMMGDIARHQGEHSSATNFYQNALRVATEIGAEREAGTLRLRLASSA
jgi:tetratricopeptide (TPR) repeat protein